MRGRAAPALRLVRWLMPSILLAFAVPGFLVLQQLPEPSGDVILSAAAMEGLRGIGGKILFVSAVTRAILWPPRGLRAFVRRYS